MSHKIMSSIKSAYEIHARKHLIRTDKASVQMNSLFLSLQYEFPSLCPFYSLDPLTPLCFLIHYSCLKTSVCCSKFKWHFCVLLLISLCVCVCVYWMRSKIESQYSCTWFSIRTTVLSSLNDNI